MKILGIDTATDILGIAVTEDKTLIAEYRSNIRRAHAERLIPSIERLLSDLKIEPTDLDGISISIGPGSFTGLRIGLAAVKGLALAADLPVVSVSTLDVLASQAAFWNEQICPIIKAQGEESYTALYKYKGEELTRLTEYRLIQMSQLEILIKEKTLILSVGINEIESYITRGLEKKIKIAPREISHTSGFSVALLGYEKILKNEFENIDQLVPFYLKDFKAKKKIGII